MTAEIQPALDSEDGPLLSISAAIKLAQDQVDEAKELVGRLFKVFCHSTLCTDPPNREHNTLASSRDMFQSFLEQGRKDKMCKMCDRKLTDHEWPGFEKKVTERSFLRSRNLIFDSYEAFGSN